MDERTALSRAMADAGCDGASIARAEALYDSGARGELVCCLRRCRSEQLDALHERQRQLDRLDRLIRETQKG